MTAAARDGLEAEEVRRVMALPSGLLEKRGARVSIAMVRRVWSALTDHRAAGPLLSLRAARQLPLGSLDILDYLTVASTTGAEAFAHLTRYLPLLADAGRVWTESDGKSFRFRHDAPGGVPSLSELLLGLIVARSRALFGPAYAPRRIHFAHAPLAAASMYEEVLGVPVRFGGRFDEIVFDRAIAEAPIASQDPRLMSILVVQAEEALSLLDVRERITHDTEFVSAFRHALALALDAGDPGLARIGERFGMSARTLQRRLAAAHVSHRELLQELRLERARRALCAARPKVVSHELGYSSPSAFHRAFKRWTGLTPGAVAEGAASPLAGRGGMSMCDTGEHRRGPPSNHTASREGTPCQNGESQPAPRERTARDDETAMAARRGA
ncbi:AraC family transcriptional regulator ligand-binding domain-containing protein [Sorangium sp. So ce381]|uniref:AraC family transcriptional regulator n=1 Tax=Sorangium sp. So ce381 TaxID=3133307 RepID=UPI003F5B6F4F